MVKTTAIGVVDSLAQLALTEWDKITCTKILDMYFDLEKNESHRAELVDRFNRILASADNTKKISGGNAAENAETPCKNLNLEQRIEVATVFFRLLPETEKIQAAWRALMIPEDDAECLLFFLCFKLPITTDSSGQIIEAIKKRILILSNGSPPDPTYEGIWETTGELNNEFIFLHFPNIGCYLIRAVGDEPAQLNGQSMTPGSCYCFKQGSTIQLSNGRTFRYEDITSIRLRKKGVPQVELTINSIEYTFAGSNQGIKPFSTMERSGCMVGVLGGSGTGKTTLLNLLSGKMKPQRGTVLLNGYDVHKEPHALMGLIGLVPQDDLLFENLTVYQNMLFNAKLCFGNYNRKQIAELVEATLKDFDLWEIRNLRVGNALDKVISGGQRKRLNIALELLREPAVLFLDEPTSGLSSNDSLMVMGLLRKLAENGKLIIVNIHQPSERLFKLFDRLWVLDRGGYPVYVGNPTDAIEYFHRHSTAMELTLDPQVQRYRYNPEDILDIIEFRTVDPRGLITTNRKVAPEEWYDLYKMSIEKERCGSNHKIPLPKTTFRLPDVIKQLAVFSKRNLLSKISNKQYVLLNILEPIALGVILSFFIKHSPGTEYLFGANRNVPAFIFMSVIVSLFLGMSVSAEEIIGDRKVLEREGFLNLSKFSYINSKVIYLFGLSAIQMLLFASVSLSIIGVKGLLFKYWLVLFSSACFANMLGLAISALMKSVVAIYITIPLLLVPQILLSGTVVDFDNLNSSLTRKVYVPVIGDLMVSRWAYEALAVTQFMDNPYESHFFDTEMQVSRASFRSSFLIPRLQVKLDECLRLSNMEQDNSANISRHLVFMANELELMAQDEDVPRFELIEELKKGIIYDDLAEELAGYLVYLKMVYQKKQSSATAQRDSIYYALKSAIGEDQVYRLKQRNHNSTLSEWVLRSNEVTKYLETENRLIQKAEPIYLLPDHRWGRAHLYAPFKYFNGQYIKTIWFNTIAIWIFSSLIYASLHLLIMGKPKRVLTRYFKKLS